MELNKQKTINFLKFIFWYNKEWQWLNDNGCSLILRVILGLSIFIPASIGFGLIWIMFQVLSLVIKEKHITWYQIKLEPTVTKITNSKIKILGNYWVLLILSLVLSVLGILYLPKNSSPAIIVLFAVTFLYAGTNIVLLLAIGVGFLVSLIFKILNFNFQPITDLVATIKGKYCPKIKWK